MNWIIKVQEYLNDLRKQGLPINSAVVIAATEGPHVVIAATEGPYV